MVVFACARCDAVLTVPVSRVALPAHTHQHYGHELMPLLVEPGTYAVNPEHFGAPWRRWAEFSEEETGARGVFAPEFSLPCGTPGAVAVAPGDTRGTVLIPERSEGYCLGLSGGDGPNVACARCGQEVATRIDDCGYWQAVWLVPDAVRRLDVDVPEPPVASWGELARERRSTPPVDPAGHWDARWQAAVGMALAHLVVAADGRPVALPGGLVTAVFRPALDVLLPQGPPEREVALVGPGLSGVGRSGAGLSGVGEPDIALVPRHPQTGEPWQPAGGSAVVPLEADVWMHLAFHQTHPLPPATGGVPLDVLRDDPLPPHTNHLFWADARVFRHTLARLPAVRRPWLRKIYDSAPRGGWLR